MKTEQEIKVKLEQTRVEHEHKFVMANSSDKAVLEGWIKALEYVMESSEEETKPIKE